MAVERIPFRGVHILSLWLLLLLFLFLLLLLLLLWLCKSGLLGSGYSFAAGGLTHGSAGFGNRHENRKVSVGAAQRRH